MSSNLLALPFRPVLNQSGGFESGATMTVYKQGTTTLEPLYEDAALTTPLGNPVVANGYGVFPAVYWDEAQPIRAVITESTGVVLFDLDPYISTVFEAEEILDLAAQRALEAAGSVTQAEEILEAVQGIEAAVESLTSPTYASIAAGLAGTTSGEYFAVLAGDVVSIYLNNAGTEVFQRSVLSATAVQAELAGKANTVHTHVIGDVTGLQAALDLKAPLASPALTGTATINGEEIGFRLVRRRTTSGTAVAEDRNGCVAVTAGFTIPNSVFAAGAAFSIYNDSAGPVTIVQGAGLTLRQAGTANTGNRTLAARGIATLWFNSASEAIISGPGVT